ncbi:MULTISPECIES: 2OG-Fe(II) oxygenase [unclassified Flavobacterium]|uniref:2OG-Fe(II) oxygenase n=1 Tax=unclassified Flavobacterium TaxID=196869 RepID=UPI0012914EE5|nr:MULTISPECIES: 2OG-Fe(II) oxygenase [unclassified Flavobacterium]MQP51363.1 2OG-Fe(II) oxygenase [Flavobacterium sp. LMO9]MQP61408.1 2OG-Fe(II) oxygenase [Flavobacterium sp. LMO6]
MEDCFEALIESYLETKVGVVEHFVSEELAQHLTNRLFDLKEQNLLKAAGIGNAAKLTQNSAIRSDAIYWLDRANNNEYENAFLDQVDAFIAYLNRSCYTGITGCEFHFALFDKGSFYRKHLDQFQDNSSRQFSMITYLNENWQPEDCGELCIYDGDATQKIAPTNRKTVFFKSNELVHEVLETHKPRLSVTGWLRRD